MKVSIVAEGENMRGAYALGSMRSLESYFGLKKVDSCLSSAHFSHNNNIYKYPFLKKDMSNRLSCSWMHCGFSLVFTPIKYL